MIKKQYRVAVITLIATVILGAIGLYITLPPTEELINIKGKLELRSSENLEVNSIEVYINNLPNRPKAEVELLKNNLEWKYEFVEIKYLTSYEVEVSIKPSTGDRRSFPEKIFLTETDKCEGENAFCIPIVINSGDSVQGIYPIDLSINQRIQRAESLTKDLSIRYEKITIEEAKIDDATIIEICEDQLANIEKEIMFLSQQSDPDILALQKIEEALVLIDNLLNSVGG